MSEPIQILIADDHTLFRIENLTNLDQLIQARVKVYALPVPVKGLAAFPLRVIAVETV